MSKFIWRKQNVWFGQEGVRGVKSSFPIWFPKTSFDFGDRIETVEDDASLGSRISTTDIEVSKHYGAGKFEGKVQANNIGELLFSLLGSNTITEVVPWKIYEHLFKIDNSNTLPTLTIFTQDPNGAFFYPLASITSLTISAVIGEFITVSVDFKSKKGEVDTQTATYTEDYPFRARNSTFKRADTEADLVGENPACIESFELVFTSESIEQYCLNAWSEPIDFINGKLEITGNITVVHNDHTTYREPAVNGTSQALQFWLEDTAVDMLWETGEHPTLEFTLPTIKYTDYTKDNSNDSLVKENISFKVYQKDSSVDPIRGRLKNTMDEY